AKDASIKDISFQPVRRSCWYMCLQRSNSPIEHPDRMLKAPRVLSWPLPGLSIRTANSSRGSPESHPYKASCFQADIPGERHWRVDRASPFESNAVCGQL